MKSFSERLRYALHKRGITQAVLAYKIGCSPSYISNYLSGRYAPNKPRIKEMARALNVSEAWLGGLSTDEPSKESYQPVQVPVVGYVAAGVPISAIQEVLDYEELSPETVRDGAEYFGLKIKGASMEPRIYDGDVVIVRKQEDVESGQIAIVCVNGDEATCKKIMKQESGILLQPLNPTYEAIFYTNEQITTLPITIIGRVIELRGKL